MVIGKPALDPAIQKIIYQSSSSKNHIQPKQCSISQRSLNQPNINIDSPSSKQQNLRNDDSIIINNNNSCSSNFMDNQFQMPNNTKNNSQSIFWRQGNNQMNSQPVLERFNSFGPVSSGSGSMPSHQQTMQSNPQLLMSNPFIRNSNYGIAGSSNNSGLLASSGGGKHTFFNRVSKQLKDDFFDDIQQNLDVPDKQEGFNFKKLQTQNAQINQHPNYTQGFGQIQNPEFILTNQQLIQQQQQLQHQQMPPQQQFMQPQNFQIPYSQPYSQVNLTQIPQHTVMSSQFVQPYQGPTSQQNSANLFKQQQQQGYWGNGLASNSSIGYPTFADFNNKQQQFNHKNYQGVSQNQQQQSTNILNDPIMMKIQQQQATDSLLKNINDCTFSNNALQTAQGQYLSQMTQQHQPQHQPIITPSIEDIVPMPIDIHEDKDMQIILNDENLDFKPVLFNNQKQRNYIKNPHQYYQTGGDRQSSSDNIHSSSNLIVGDQMQIQDSKSSIGNQ
eukprot:403333533